MVVRVGRRGGRGRVLLAGAMLLLWTISMVWVITTINPSTTLMNILQFPRFVYIGAVRDRGTGCPYQAPPSRFGLFTVPNPSRRDLNPLSIKCPAGSYGRKSARREVYSYDDSVTHSGPQMHDEAPPERANGVVVYLANTPLVDLLTSLVALDANLNCATDYPVLIFHEDLSAEQMKLIVTTTTSRVRFWRVDFAKMLPKSISVEQAAEWSQKHSHPNWKYQVMTRFWSGLMQNHPALQPYEYYLRLDDDSFFVEPMFWGGTDILTEMDRNNLKYVYRNVVGEPYGTAVLDDIVKEYVVEFHDPSAFERLEKHGFWKNDHRTQWVPYNNLHWSALDVWRGPRAKWFYRKFDETLIFQKHLAGDASVHGVMLPLMAQDKEGVCADTSAFYQHNIHVSYPGYRVVESRPHDLWYELVPTRRQRTRS